MATVFQMFHIGIRKNIQIKELLLLIGGYAHLVPYVMDGDDYFLKTIIPNRKENKKVKGE